VKCALELRVNGVTAPVYVDVAESLLEVVRNHLGLTGSKMGCNGGDCGACTVHLDGRPINACLLLAVEAEGHEVTTIEGLAAPDGLHPVQRTFIDSFGVQCGFCTSGMIMSAAALFNDVAAPTEQEIRDALHGII
jgi:aerobic-type carbon monoxide dehydrogenase small subunit (CoxS/CutS family)